MSEPQSAVNALAELDRELAELRQERDAIAAQIAQFNSPEQRERRAAARVRHAGAYVLARPLTAAWVDALRKHAEGEAREGWLFAPKVLAADGIEVAEP